MRSPAQGNAVRLRSGPATVTGNGSQDTCSEGRMLCAAFLIQKMKDLKGAAGSLLFLYKGVSLC